MVQWYDNIIGGGIKLEKLKDIEFYMYCISVIKNMCNTCDIETE